MSFENLAINLKYLSCTKQTFEFEKIGFHFPRHILIGRILNSFMKNKHPGLADLELINFLFCKHWRNGQENKFNFSFNGTYRILLTFKTFETHAGLSQIEWFEV